LKKILILTFYYEPDLCAGSFRMTPLVKTLRECASSKIEIDVITTMPNRYATFRKMLLIKQQKQKKGLKIIRIPIPEHQGKMFDQAKAFSVFAYKTIKRIRGEQYDLVMASSSRLMTAVLACLIAWKKKSRFYLDVRDIFVENIEKVIPLNLFAILKPIFTFLERYVYKRANHINLISPGFKKYFLRFKHKKITFHTHGIDKTFINLALQNYIRKSFGRPFKIIYAGNIGAGQGLENILPKLAKDLTNTARFEIIGDGGRRKRLQDQILLKRLTNVKVCPPISRERLLQKYKRADILFLHLNNLPAFKTLLPSKLFEYAATGKPIWAGLCGFSKKFAQKQIKNCAVFESGNKEDALNALFNLKKSSCMRTSFIKKYNLQKIYKQIAHEMLKLIS